MKLNKTRKNLSRLKNLYITKINDPGFNKNYFDTQLSLDTKDVPLFKYIV